MTREVERFATGTDESNILEATREPFPSPNGANDT
jgi:hypothetical protein